MWLSQRAQGTVVPDMAPRTTCNRSWHGRDRAGLGASARLPVLRLSEYADIFQDRVKVDLLGKQASVPIIYYFLPQLAQIYLLA